MPDKNTSTTAIEIVDKLPKKERRFLACFVALLVYGPDAAMINFFALDFSNKSCQEIKQAIREIIRKYAP